MPEGVSLARKFSDHPPRRWRLERPQEGDDVSLDVRVLTGLDRHIRRLDPVQGDIRDGIPRIVDPDEQEK